MPVSDHIALKIAGTMFATIVAPILVAVALKYSDAVFPEPAAAPAPMAATGSVAKPAVKPPIARSSVHTGPPQVATASLPGTLTSPATVPQPATVPPAATALQPVIAPQTMTAASTIAPSSTAPPANPPPGTPYGPTVRLFNGFGLGGWMPVFGTQPDGQAQLPPRVKSAHGKQSLAKQSQDKPAVGKLPVSEHVFRVLHGQLHVSGRLKGVLITKQEYRNYRLTIEFKWGSKIWNEEDDPYRDSGVLLHCQGTEPVVRDLWPLALRCSIAEGHTGDLIPMAADGSRFSIETEGEKRRVMTRVGMRSNFFYTPGAPVTIFSNGAVRAIGCEMAGGTGPGQRPRQKYELPVGQWNTLECLCQGNTVTVFLNRAKINSVSRLNHVQGRIALQSMNAELIIRSILLEPIGPQ